MMWSSVMIKASGLRADVGVYMRSVWGSLCALSKALLALCAPGSARVCCVSSLGLALPLGLGRFRVS